MGLRKIVRHAVNPKSIKKAVSNPTKTYWLLLNNFHSVNNPHEKMEELQQRYSRYDEEKYIAKLSDFLGEYSESLQKYYSEYESDIRPHVENTSTLFENKPFMMGGVEVEAPILYSMIRACKPENVLEIGVANGVSSYYILSALERNDSGKLISIDIPKYEDSHSGEWEENAGAWIPGGREIGWIVPEKYTTRWERIIGDMNELLPIILENTTVDFFVYDGPKGYYTRKEAFEEVLNETNSCGYFCDDIAWNNSFEEFAAENELRWKTFGNIGVARS